MSLISRRSYSVIKLMLVIALAVGAQCARADVPIFSVPANASLPIHDVDDPSVVADYAVVPNIRGLADNLTLDRPRPIIVALPGQASILMDVKRTSPVEGFEVGDKGAFRIIPGTPDEKLSFNLYAVAYGKELSLVIHRGQMTGSLTGMLLRPGQAWTIVQSKGKRVLRDMDTSSYPQEPLDAATELPDGAPMLSNKAAVDGGGVIDVLVLHTANALAQAGSPTALDELIRGSFADVTLALDNSQASRVRVNHVVGGTPDAPIESEFVTYDESPGIGVTQSRWFAHRTWARTNVQAQTLRNQYQADLVVLLVGDSGTCGVAYTQRPNCGSQSGESGLCDVGAGYAEFAVSVIGTRPLCGLPTRTLAHEVGHQFGMEHDPPNGALAPLASFPWSYGYTVSNSQVQARSIMAYEIAAGGNANCPYKCPIQVHYSNPNVEFTSLPGTLSGTKTTDPTGRHSFNARTAVLYAAQMAKFRGPVAVDAGVFGHGFEPLPDIFCNPSIWPNCPK